VLRQNSEWLHIDDTNITVISEADVTVDLDGAKDSNGYNHTHYAQTNGGLMPGEVLSESAALAAALSASSIAASKSSDGVAYVLFYIRTDQKNSAASSSGSTTPTSTQPKPPSTAWTTPKK